MRRLSLIFLVAGAILFVAFQVTDSPHGEKFDLDCAVCHSPEGWTLDKAHYAFDHSSTQFPLLGQHESFNCRNCHETLVFSEAETECISCHSDIHQQTVGMDCERCHTPENWLVYNITELHQLSRFPLIGPHVTAACSDCHISASNLQFEPLGIECFDCHKADYLAATNPNHVEGNFSTNCVECHAMYAFTWTGSGIDHSFFPLNQGHAISDCYQCHTAGTDFSNISNECISCHQQDYNTTENPNHTIAEFSMQCSECHTTAPGWKPADFRTHDGQYFPIYSGQHNGEWNACIDCHSNPSNYQIFTCIDCHEHNQADTDDEHDEVAGYVYESSACFACHPTGDGEGSFDHNATAFPLTGAHTQTECIDCHENGYAGTSTDCYVCHEVEYVESVNPKHLELEISTDCNTCHTTQPEWQPAIFDQHNEIYPLLGAHAEIANNCVDCHNGEYNNTPNLCVGCHLEAYNQTTNPPHEAAQFSQDCETCHTSGAWEPATFDHDGQYFPIYSGEHNGEWDACIDCHTTANNYALFSCIDCHEHDQMSTDREHQGVGGYIYESLACFECHPDGSSSGSFNHNTSNFPLTGAHISTSCIECHESGYSGTPTDCFACHEPDFNQSVNPNHVELNLANECELCHTTNAGWEPASFDNHNDFYVIEGAHVSIANNCAECHNGNYQTTPNTCVGCHQEDYNNTTNPPHEEVQFTTDCETCHTQAAWEPATFDHDGQYFPIYSGEHNGEWNACIDCHTTPNNYAMFSCIDCHEHWQTPMAEDHQRVGGYLWESLACFECHPDGSSSGSFNHNTSNFPLTGAHISTSCIECHESGYSGTPTDCFACHEPDFNQSVNPNHVELNLANECELCHTTNAGWEPASFDNHNDFYVIEGAHVSIANNCAECHNGNYNTTPNTCVGCHQEDYNNTTNPPHEEVQFTTDCETCHTQAAWEPATFDHDGQYFPIYSGEHNGEWNACIDCHTTPNNYAMFSCIDCHEHWQAPMAEDHQRVGGYLWESLACFECHPDGSSNGAFNHNTSNFPLTGAHTSTSCIECHENGYSGTSSDCFACHEPDFNQSVNPNHVELNLANECDLCHTTNAGWEPASFDNHNDFYVIEGAHTSIANNCAECHNGNYNNTPNTCFACHEDDYNQTNDPPHQSAQFPVDCETCHTQSAWEPATFDHDGMYFPIYSGEHNREWNTCSDCHENPGNYSIFSCFGCHSQPEMNDEHQGVSGYQYNNFACLECHPDGSKPLHKSIFNSNIRIDD